MVGGMLVLFIYITRIASNEIFNYSNKIILIISFIFLRFLLLNNLTDTLIINIKFIFLESILKHHVNFNLAKYFNYPSISIIFFIISYLFITLIAVVKITKIEYGPLRQTY